MSFRVLASALAAAGLSASALAIDNPSTEAFVANNANWRASDAITGLNWSAAGGSTPDSAGFVSTSRSFANDPVSTTQPPVLMNARAAWGSSGGVFFGDWIAAGVTSFSFDFRHNAPEAVTVFARFAGPGNFPGATAISFIPVPANIWTTVTIAINPASPNFVSFEGTNFTTVFGANNFNGNAGIGRLQIGVFVSATLAGTTPSYTFDLDNVRVIPAPSAAIAMAGLVALRRRRR